MGIIRCTPKRQDCVALRWGGDNLQEFEHFVKELPAGQDPLSVEMVAAFSFRRLKVMQAGVVVLNLCPGDYLVWNLGKDRMSSTNQLDRDYDRVPVGDPFVSPVGGG